MSLIDTTNSHRIVRISGILSLSDKYAYAKPDTMRVIFHICDPRRYKGTGVAMCSFATIDAGRCEPLLFADTVSRWPVIAAKESSFASRCIQASNTNPSK